MGNPMERLEEEPVQQEAEAGLRGSRSSSATCTTTTSCAADDDAVVAASWLLANHGDHGDAGDEQQQKRISGCSSTPYGTEGSGAEDLDDIRESPGGAARESEPSELRRRGVMAAASLRQAKEEDESAAAGSLEPLVESAVLKEMEVGLREAQVAVAKDLLLVQREELSMESTRLQRKLQISQQRGEHAEHHGQATRCNARNLLALLWKLKGKPACLLAPDQADEAAGDEGKVFRMVRMIIAENVASKRQNEALQERLASEKEVVQAQLEQIAQMQGRYESKIKRLTEQLESSKKEHAETQEELEALRNSTEAWSSEDRERLELLESRVNNGMIACPSEQPPAEDCEYSADWSDDEGDDLRSRLRSVEQDRSALLSTLEWKEIQWKTHLENMEREAMDTRRRRHGEVTRRASEPAPQPLSQQPACPMMGSRLLSSMLGKLRPSFLARSLSTSTTHQASAGPEPTFCQDTCWQTLNAVSGAIVFKCSVDGDFTILESSQEAGRIWGSAALGGKSVLWLTGPQSASWLRFEFKRQEEEAAAAQVQAEAEAPGGKQLSGFSLRDLGRETFFVAKRGQLVDYTVKVIRFPAEAACGREPAFLVILDPEAPAFSPSPSESLSGGAKSKSSPDPELSARSRSRKSTMSSASSVAPSDSASNICGDN